jgi:hypothetical protein
MFKVTCLIALKRKDRRPRILHLEILVYLLLKVFVHRLRNDSLEITGLEQQKVVGWQIVRRSRSWWCHDQAW